MTLRNGFMLAMEEEGGKLGGQEIELLVEEMPCSPISPADRGKLIKAMRSTS